MRPLMSATPEPGVAWSKVMSYTARCGRNCTALPPTCACELLIGVKSTAALIAATPKTLANWDILPLGRFGPQPTPDRLSPDTGLADAIAKSRRPGQKGEPKAGP